VQEVRGAQWARSRGKAPRKSEDILKTPIFRKKFSISENSAKKFCAQGPLGLNPLEDQDFS